MHSKNVVVVYTCHSIHPLSTCVLGSTIVGPCSKLMSCRATKAVNKSASGGAETTLSASDGAETIPLASHGAETNPSASVRGVVSLWIGWHSHPGRLMKEDSSANVAVAPRTWVRRWWAWWWWWWWSCMMKVV